MQKKKDFLFFFFCSKRIATKVKTKTWSLFFSTFLFDCRNQPQDMVFLFFFLSITWSLLVFVEVFSKFFFSLVSKKKTEDIWLFFVPFQKTLSLLKKKEASCGLLFIFVFSCQQSFFLFDQSFQFDVYSFFLLLIVRMKINFFFFFC